MENNNPLFCTTQDRLRLRELAKKHVEIAGSPKNLERVALWKRHNAFKGERPVIHIEAGTFQHQVLAPLLRCESPLARSVEYNLLQDFINLEQFDDDKVVPPYYMLGINTGFCLFDIRVKESIITNSAGTAQGHKFEHPVKNLHDDFEIFGRDSKITVDMDNTLLQKNALEELFGDILPVRLSMGSLYAVPTQKVVHLMGMENMLFAMYDYPEEFKQMMSRIADEYCKYFKLLEGCGCLLQNNEFEPLAQGSMCFWDEPEKEGKILTSDVWGFMDSQETVGISPDMFEEFIFPCYEKIGRLFGRLSYGCCEPVSAVWDCIKRFDNLKKVSISPWCDEELMANELRGKNIIFHRKPSPNYLGVGDTLDEEGFRKHIEATLKTARGCHVEITQRDVYTINNDINRVRRYVEIIRESIESCW
ncbi:MAG: hypothetical protein GX851_07530 [Clostridiales bacterium]|nr:hypothetical protein [Clostridiales bacterium]